MQKMVEKLVEDARPAVTREQAMRRSMDVARLHTDGRVEVNMWGTWRPGRATTVATEYFLFRGDNGEFATVDTAEHWRPLDNAG